MGHRLTHLFPDGGLNTLFCKEVKGLLRLYFSCFHVNNVSVKKRTTKLSPIGLRETLQREDTSVTSELAMKTLDSESKQTIINEYGIAALGRRASV